MTSVTGKGNLRSTGSNRFADIDENDDEEKDSAKGSGSPAKGTGSNRFMDIDEGTPKATPLGQAIADAKAKNAVTAAKNHDELVAGIPNMAKAAQETAPLGEYGMAPQRENTTFRPVTMPEMMAVIAGGQQIAERRNAAAVDADQLAKDIEQKRAEVNSLRQQQDELYRSSAPEVVAKRESTEQALGTAQQELTALLQQQEKTQQAQSYYRYADLSGNEDYAEKSQFVQQPIDPYDALNNRASLYDFVNDKNGARQKIASEYERGPSYLYGDWTPYAHLSEDEKGVFNYIYATEGEDAAKEYLDYLTESLTARQGADIAERMKNAGGVSQALYGVTSGVNQFGSGIQRTIQRTFAENPQMDTTAVEYATSNILNDLDEEGKKGAEFAFKVAQMAGQMAPSILLSGAVGSILKSAGLGAKALGIAKNALFSGSVGASSSGNAYKAGIEQYGMNHEQAQMYANLVGASEGGLTYLLGGFGQGGALVNKLLGSNGVAKFAAKVANIDNALVRFVRQFGGQLLPRMGGEVIEENLQLVLEPAFRTILTGEDYDAPEINEIIETTLLSAVTSGLMSAPSAVGTAMQGGRPTPTPTQQNAPELRAEDLLLGANPAVSENAQNAVETPAIPEVETVAENNAEAQNATGDVKLSEDVAAEFGARQNKMFGATPEGMGAASSRFTVGHAPTYAQNQEHSTQPLLNDEAREAGADIGTHEVLSNKDTRYYALERLGVDFDAEVADLRAKSEWDAIEMEMGQLILREYAHEAAETGDYSKLVDWKRNVLDPHKTTAGQALQVLAQYAESSPESIIADAAETLATREKQDGTGDGNTVKTEKFKNLLDDISKYAQRLDSIQDGDTAALIELIKELDAKRHTTGLFTKKTGKAMSAALEAAAARPGGFEKLKAIAAAQTRNVAEDMKHISPLEAFKSYRIMSMLSKIATYARNTIGNTVSYAGDVIANDAAVLIDMLMSKGTNTRELAFDRGPFSKEAWREAADSALFSFIEVGLDANASQATSKYEQSAGRTFKMTGNLLSRFLSTVSKYENLGLITADEFSKGLTRGEARRGLIQLARQGKANADFIEDRASELAKQRTFTNDGKISSAMTGLRNIGNAARLTDRYGGSFGLGDIAIPFAKVPGNITSMAAQATPAGLAKSVMDVASVLVKAHNGTLEPGEQANAATAFGRGLVGTAGVFAAALLALKGILVYVDSDDKDELAIKKAQGLQRGLNINLSAAKRLVNGDGGEQLQEGDEFKSIDYLETLSAQLTMGAILADIFKEESGVSLRNIASANIEALGSAFIELPAVSQIQDIINGYTYSDAEDAAGKLGDAAVSFAGGQATSLIPNFFRGLVSSGDMNIRNPYATDSEGETVVNQIKQNIPGLRDDVPVSLDPLGNERTYSGTKLDRFVNANLAPGSNSVYSSNPIYDAMLDVGVYANKSAPNKVEFKGESLKLTADEKAQYQQTYGDIIESVVTEMVESSVWQGASKEVQGDMMRDVLSLASQEAKGEFLASRGLGEPEDEEKLDKMDLSDLAEYIAVDKAFSAAEKADDFDAIEALLGDYNALSDEAKELMDNSHSRLDDIAAANDAGISVADWDKAYTAWKGIKDAEGMTASAKATEFAAWVDTNGFTRSQGNVLKDLLSYSSGFTVGADKYEDLTGNGLSAKDAQTIVEEIAALTPLPGAKDVSNAQKYSEILSTFRTQNQQMAALESYMPESTYAKLETAVDGGFSAKEFVDFYSKFSTTDAKENGKTVSGLKKQRVKDWALEYGFTNAEFDTLWKLFN